MTEDEHVHYILDWTDESSLSVGETLGKDSGRDRFCHLRTGPREVVLLSPFLPLQFPNVTSLQTLSTTLRACVFLRKSLTDEF